MKENNIKTVAKARSNSKTEKLLTNYETQLNNLYKLGYREIPKNIEDMILATIQHKDEPTFIQDKTPNPFNGIHAKQRYATLSWGMFDELQENVDTAQYYHALLNTGTKKIMEFLTIDNTDNYKADPVVFALNIDPQFKKYPGISPYAFCANNPILYIDKDGQDYGVYVDHATKTIIIKATIYTTAESQERAQSAANVWNGNNKFAYSITDPKTGVVSQYDIKFELTVECHDMPQYAAMNNNEANSFEVLPNNNKIFEGKNNPGATEPDHKRSYSKQNIDGVNKQLETDAHEIGHTLTAGEGHSDGGLMNPSLEGGSLEIQKSTVQNILKSAGIGGNDSPKVDKTDKPHNPIHEQNTEQKPTDFEKGKVIEK
jgi:hypothetical protein